MVKKGKLVPKRNLQKLKINKKLNALEVRVDFKLNW